MKPTPPQRPVQIGGIKAETLLKGIVLLTGLFLAVLLWKQPVSKPCLFSALLNRPCLGCGGTEALRALATGRLLDSLRANPLLLTLVLGLLYWILEPIMFPTTARKIGSSLLVLTVGSLLFQGIKMVCF